MIKARGVRDGRPLLVIGLSRGNTERLLAGEPILFGGEEVGLPGLSVLVLGGDTEAAMVDSLRKVGFLPSEEGS